MRGAARLACVARGVPPWRGPDRLLAAPAEPPWRILLRQLRSIVVLLLAAAAGLSLVLGDPLDTAAVGVVLVINTDLGFAMELRARRGRAEPRVQPGAPWD